VGVVSVTGVANAKDVTRFKAEGATASHFSSDGATTLNFAATRDDTNASKPVTNFNFQRQTCDGNGCTGIRGFGQIPNSDFKVQDKNARLNVNLAAVAGYTAFSYTFDFNTGTETQEPITPPSVNVEWKQLKGAALIQIKTSGTQVIKIGPTTTKQVGTTFFTKASISGTFANVPLVDAGSDNNLGNNENVNITITQD
jgi:hypothetical protein